MRITFLNPLYLTFLVSIPFFIIIHFLILKHIKRRALKFANFELIAKATGEQVLNKNIVLLIIRLFALVLLILSVAGTTIWYEKQTTDSDFIIAIDSSSSMLADDFFPNRLTAAKDSAIEFIDNLPTQSTVGVISFAGTSFVEILPTTDRNLAEDKIYEMTIRPVGGTDLGEALVTSTNMLLSSKRAKSIVLLTDGQSNTGTDPEFGAEYAADNHVTVFTIGVATISGGRFSRIEAISRLDEETLINIAESTGGKYFKAETVEQLTKAYEEIAKTSEHTVSLDLILPFMLIALLLLFVEWGLINTKFRTLP